MSDLDDWENADEDDIQLQKKPDEDEWSDKEEEEEEDPDEKMAKLREEKAKLLERLSEIDDILPKELPKESSKKGKATKRLIKEKEEEEKRRAEEMTKSEAQVSLQRKIEESDFENAQDMFGSGGKAQEGTSDSGRFESWNLSCNSKQKDVEEFAEYTAAKIIKFQDEFLYLALIRKLLQETTKSIDSNQVKELMLVLTKGREDFNVADLLRYLIRDADKDLSEADIEDMLNKELKIEEKALASKSRSKAPEKVKLTARQLLMKVLLHDLVRDCKPEEVLRIIEEGCGLTLTREQQGKIAHKKAELQGDPSAQKQAGKGSARVADHKSMSMYDAFGTGGGEDWGGGGGTRGDDYDFM
ncbi:hypothetical protein GUITHDRAFT_161553 [Guillardia theta CCMP2712]|uniref:Eukaryotic translation initiation factor 3 30 kDa subunit n=2 Tax=Guillardia theta TaxID=55529 RepID=L1JT85_GUITC|nr:hypothetical protein GUITHDRAFT_161553 [Guillardia theta CCMP2712]EKX51534.1 hypothetical protein GUITHDRAFT_161553 [Guillardia theta CCMP2712]|eukprot:XP_005838514.1 hypothetical protein GUITHDRAFT_161553 [Guillardia theta CCMP2712]